VRVAFTTDPEDRPAVQTDFLTGAVSVFLVLVIIGLGCLPNQVMHIATTAVRAIL